MMIKMMMKLAHTLVTEERGWYIKQTKQERKKKEKKRGIEVIIQLS